MIKLLLSLLFAKNDIYDFHENHIFVSVPREKFSYAILNPQARVAQKVANEVVFRRFQGEGGGFF